MGISGPPKFLCPRISCRLPASSSDSQPPALAQAPVSKRDQEQQKTSWQRLCFPWRDRGGFLRWEGLRTLPSPSSWAPFGPEDRAQECFFQDNRLPPVSLLGLATDSPLRKALRVQQPPHFTEDETNPERPSDEPRSAAGRPFFLLTISCF